MQNLAEREARQSFTRRTLIPFIYAGLLVLLSIWIAGSYLIEIEDHYANVIFGGGYGSYEAYAANIHPWLGGLIASLYKWMPSVNWFGVALLSLLFASGAAAASLTAHEPGRLIPGLAVLSPILVVLVCSLQSRVVGALCVISGALCVVDGCADGRRGIRRVVSGVLLLVAGTALSMETAWVLTALTLLLALTRSRESFRARALRVSLPLVIIAVGAASLAACLDAEWRVFHNNYFQYERAVNSFLIDDVEDLLGDYGVISTIDGGSENIDQEDRSALLTLEEATEASTIGKIGWSLNDADLFVRRSGVDSELTAPDAVAKVNQHAGHISTRGFAARLKDTVKKTQFLMLLGLFFLCALVIELTNLRRGLHTLAASLVALGGHAAMLLINRDSFRDIAPFYLLAIISLLTDYDARASLERFRLIIRSSVFRNVIAGVAAAAFVTAMSVLLVMVRDYNEAVSPSLVASEELYDAMEKLPDAVFIGDNPLDRYNPSALAVPRFDADSRLPAGSYDLYSPRQRRILDRFSVTNPIKDAVDRLDIVYVDMSGATLTRAVQRIYQSYDRIAVTAQPTVGGEPVLSSNGQHRMQLYWLQSVTENQLSDMLANYENAQENSAADMELERAEEEGRLIRIVATEPDARLLEEFTRQYGYTYRTEIGVDELDGVPVVDYIAIENPPPGYDTPPPATGAPGPATPAP